MTDLPVERTARFPDANPTAGGVDSCVSTMVTVLPRSSERNRIGPLIVVPFVGKINVYAPIRSVSRNPCCTRAMKGRSMDEGGAVWLARIQSRPLLADRYMTNL